MQSSIARPRRLAPRARPLLIVGVAALVAAGSYVAGGITGSPRSTPARQATVSLPADAPGLADGPLAGIDEAIAVWTGNLRRDEADFIAATNLAELYLARVRITADSADIARALDAATTALDANPDLLAAVLLRGQAHFANHDFTEAADDARTVLDAQPGGAPEALAALGDAQLELGDYDAARATYASLADGAAGPAVDAREARLASLTGDLSAARARAGAAAAAATSDPDTRPETVAWYQTLAGSLAFQDGDLAGSEAAYRAALDAWGGSAAALAGLARVTAANGDFEAAIGLYERAIAILPRPETLAALGDLYALRGREDDARATYAKVAAVASLSPSDRQVALFEANHDGDVERAVALARKDLRTRHDVYAHDTLAWALLAAGRPEEAAAEIALARAEGTQDPLIDYHAGMIAAANGDAAEARTILSTLLERHPGFDPLQAKRAAETLASIGGRP